MQPEVKYICKNTRSVALLTMINVTNFNYFFAIFAIVIAILQWYVVKSYQFTNENLEEFIHIILNDIGKIDLGIGLHSCGSFTDLVMEVCR